MSYLLKIVRGRESNIPNNVVTITNVVCGSDSSALSYQYYTRAELVELFDEQFQTRFSACYVSELSERFAALQFKTTDHISDTGVKEHNILIDCEAFLVDCETKRTLQAVRPPSEKDLKK